MSEELKQTPFVQRYAELQNKMIAKKDKENKFGGYNYRTAEGILSAAKPLAKALGIVLHIDESLTTVEGQIFMIVIAEARDMFSTTSVKSRGHAMHSITKKGMDAAQISGSASSYAKKYALQNLLAIDDRTQDPDALNEKMFKRVDTMIKDAESKEKAAANLSKILKAPSDKTPQAVKQYAQELFDAKFNNEAPKGE